MSARNKRRIMRRFKLDEISSVDTPAQEGALMTLLKGKARKATTPVNTTIKPTAGALAEKPEDEEEDLESDEVDPEADEEPELDAEGNPVEDPTPGEVPGKLKPHYEGTVDEIMITPDDEVPNAADRVDDTDGSVDGSTTRQPGEDGAMMEPAEEEVDPALEEEEPVEEEVDPAAAAAAGTAKPKPKPTFGAKPKPKKASLARRLVKRYIDPMDGAKTFSEVLACYKEEEDYRELMNKTWPMVSALNTSLQSVLADKKLDAGGKATKMRTSVEGFLAAVREIMPEVEEVLEKVLAADQQEYAMTKLAKAAGADSSTKEKDDDALAKAVAEAVEKALAPEKAAREKAEGELATFKAVAALTGDEKEHYDKCKTDEAKAAFLKLEPKARIAAVKKAIADEETIEVAGQVIVKSEVGAGIFAVLKAQSAQMVALQKDVATEREAREQLDFAKRAGEEMKHLPGTDEEKTGLFKALSALDKGHRETLEKMLKVADKAVNLAFERVGSSDRRVHATGIDKANGKGEQHPFEKRIASIRKDEECTRTEAMRKARLQSEQEFQDWQSQ